MQSSRQTTLLTKIINYSEFAFSISVAMLASPFVGCSFAWNLKLPPEAVEEGAVERFSKLVSTKVDI